MSQRLPMDMSALPSPLMSLVVIIKASMRCGSVVVVSNPVQSISVYMRLSFYHLRLTRYLNALFRLLEPVLGLFFILEAFLWRKWPKALVIRAIYE